MAKKSTKIAATYFITIIASLLLIGGVGYFMITSYLNQEPEEKHHGMSDLMSEDNKAFSPDGEYIPSASDSQTILFIYEAEKAQTSVCFVLARFIPEQAKVVMVPLQTDIRAELDGKTNTLYEFYRLGGTANAKKAAENALDIKIDKYLKFTRESFTSFSNMMGNISYNVPYNLISKGDSGEDIVIKRGEQLLDAGALRKVMCFPDYDGGEEYRAKVVGTLSCALVNSGANGILVESYQNVFSDVMNSDIETDITKYDFDAKKNAIEYVLKKNSCPAEIVIPSGVYAEDGCYDLDKSFIEALPNWLAMAS